MVLRQKVSTRIAGAAGLALSMEWLVDEWSPQAVVSVGIALLFFVASLRALIVVRDDTVYRRGLFGWDKSPLLLDDLTAVSLRREAQIRYFPLTLRLSGPAGAEVSIECWAWRGWRGLAHVAGHFARQLDARRDDVTERRMGCARRSCEWESHASNVAGGRRAGPPPDDDLSELGIVASVGVIAGLFAFGFAFGLFGGWFRTDLDVGPLVPFGLVCGGFFAASGVLVVLWEKAKGPPPQPPSSPDTTGTRT